MSDKVRDCLAYSNRLLAFLEDFWALSYLVTNDGNYIDIDCTEPSGGIDLTTTELADGTIATIGIYDGEAGAVDGLPTLESARFRTCPMIAYAKHHNDDVYASILADRIMYSELQFVMNFSVPDEHHGLLTNAIHTGTIDWVPIKTIDQLGLKMVPCINTWTHGFSVIVTVPSFTDWGTFDRTGHDTDTTIC